MRKELTDETLISVGDEDPCIVGFEAEKISGCWQRVGGLGRHDDISGSMVCSGMVRRMELRGNVWLCGQIWWTDS
jgi:hypothetical protein